mgnify:FL=1
MAEKAGDLGSDKGKGGSSADEKRSGFPKKDGSLIPKPRECVSTKVLKKVGGSLADYVKSDDKNSKIKPSNGENATSD